MANKLKHITFIMDGNNRWSKKNQAKLFDSYYKGGLKLLKLSNFIFSNYQTNYISAFALSIKLKPPVEIPCVAITQPLSSFASLFCEPAGLSFVTLRGSLSGFF